jgi:hypothetical protein
MARTMALLGCPSVRDLSPAWIRNAPAVSATELPHNPTGAVRQ